jgi:hypothetical protein
MEWSMQNGMYIGSDKRIVIYTEWYTESDILTMIYAELYIKRFIQSDIQGAFYHLTL